MLLTTQLTTDLGKDIYAYLSKLESLPKSGFIAGQSIVSALLNLYGKGQVGPINDIDVYELEKKKHPRSMRLCFYPEQYRIGYHPKADDAQEDSYLGVDLFNVKKCSLFHITSVKYNGLLNIIKITSHSNDFKVTPYQVLESFDLNMVKIGLDIKTKKLCWTSEFEFFIKTGQLEVTNVNSVFHTACRVEKKKAEMPWLYTNDDLNIKALLLPKIITRCVIQDGELSIDTDNNPIIRRENVFGKKYKNIFDSSKTLKHIFEIEQHQGKSIYSFDIKKSYIEMIDKNFLHYGKEVIDTNFQKVNISSAASALAPVLAKNYITKNGKHVENAKKELNNQNKYTRLQIDTYGHAYLKGQVQSEWATRIEKLLKKHSGLSYLFTGKPLCEQSEIYTNLKRLNTEFGEYVYGLFETKSFTTSDILDYSNIKNQIQKYHDSQAKPFDNFESLPSYVTPSGVIIKDLGTRLEIMSEGVEMHHCVGGYASSVSEGHCRILSLRCGEHKSTAEIRRANAKMLAKAGVETDGNDFNTSILKVVQHRSFANRDPSNNHKDSLSEYIWNHNKKICGELSRLIQRDKAVVNKLLEIANEKFTIPYNGRCSKLEIVVHDEIETIRSAMEHDYMTEIPVASFNIRVEGLNIDTVVLAYIENELCYISNNTYGLEKLSAMKKITSRNYNITTGVLHMLINKIQESCICDANA